ncbi:MAG: methyltransferase domain-containing protein [Candidatus Omnitrophica bacterium]|nr:methyltransferase domain-containing protein [Candidatus Omnitrophota bacterium]
MEEIRCDLCGANHHTVVYHSEQKERLAETIAYRISEEKLIAPEKILKCVNCGLVFVPAGDNSQLIIKQYEKMVDEGYLTEESGRRKTAVKVLKKMQKYQKKGKILLDVGCSTGFFLDEAQKQGWQVQGVELSIWAAKIAREKFGIKVMNSTLNQASFPANSFDMVVLHDTIEHLLCPREMLIEVRRILKPEGVVYINTPDIESLASRILKAKWWGINRHHLFYFSRKTLNRLLEATGFKSIRWGLYARSFTLKYWLERVKPYNETIFKIIQVICRISGLEKKFLTINFRDQIEVFAVKRRALKYLNELEVSSVCQPDKIMKTIVVLPAYNAAKTLKATYDDIPKDLVSEIILVDDASTDNTVEIAKELGITVFVHQNNKGYGANQKTCYLKALEHGADIVVMVHPDYQYDPRVIADLIVPFKKGEADAVFGSRMLKGGALIGGMPLWKHNVNILLTALANVVLKTYLSEYHSGFRAYSAEFLRSINFEENSDNFVFDFEIIVQARLHFCRIEEVPIRTRYFDEASSIKLFPSIRYGLGILLTILKFLLHEHNIIRFKQYE